MSEVLRLHSADEKPDLIMLLTEDDAFTVEVQKDEKGEFIILPRDFMPEGKERKVRVGTKFHHEKRRRNKHE